MDHHLRVPSSESDTSTEGSDLRPRQGRSTLAPDPVRPVTPPSSPIGPDGHTGDDVEIGAVAHEVCENKDAQPIVASLTAVLDKLSVIQSFDEVLDPQPAKITNIPLSIRDLTLLCSLLKCDLPSPSRNKFTAPEQAAVQALRDTRAEQVDSLGYWLSRRRSDFYDGHLIIRMQSLIHQGVTNYFSTYLYKRLRFKLNETGRPDYTEMLQQGGSVLTFNKKRTRTHEPDSCIWLDFSEEFAGNDSEEEADRARAHARAQASQQQNSARTDQEEGSEADPQDPGRWERQARVDSAGGEDAAATSPNPEPDQVQDESRVALPETSIWPAIVIEVGWSNPTTASVCTNYIKNSRGHIRCVIRLNMDYIEPKEEHKFSSPARAIMDGWRLNEKDPADEPVHFIEAVDVLAASPNDKVFITLNDLHQSLAATKTVSLSLSKIAGFVRKGFQRQKGAQRDAPDSEETGDIDEDPGEEGGLRRSKRLRI